MTDGGTGSLILEQLSDRNLRTKLLGLALIVDIILKMVEEIIYTKHMA